MKIIRFEDIRAWQEARKLVGLVYQAISKSSAFRMDRRLVDQIQGAAVSSMSNIAEGFSRKGIKEFVQYLFISKSSAA
jgi:four helix bundle protein